MHSKTNLSIDFIVFCGGKSPIDILIVRSHHIDGNENNWDVRHCIKTTKIVQNFYSVKYIINELCHCPIQRVDENMHYQIITLWIELVEKKPILGTNRECVHSNYIPPEWESEQTVTFFLLLFGLRKFRPDILIVSNACKCH